MPKMQCYFPKISSRLSKCLFQFCFVSLREREIVFLHYKEVWGTEIFKKKSVNTSHHRHQRSRHPQTFLLFQMTDFLHKKLQFHKFIRHAGDTLLWVCVCACEGMAVLEYRGNSLHQWGWISLTYWLSCGIFSIEEKTSLLLLLAVVATAAAGCCCYCCCCHFAGLLLSSSTSCGDSGTRPSPGRKKRRQDNEKMEQCFLDLFLLTVDKGDGGGLKSIGAWAYGQKVARNRSFDRWREKTREHPRHSSVVQ